MRDTKRKRLEAAGWVVGDVDDFLDLSPDEVAYLDMKVKLSIALREKRQKKKLTQKEVATLIKSSQSRVAKMERGDSSVSLDLLMKTLISLGATTKELGKLIAAS